MRIAVMIVRILLGLMFVFFSVVVLFKLMPQPELTGDVKTFMEGVAVSVYLMPLIKITELVCGIALLINRFVPLALVILFPIIINIVLFHAFLEPSGLPMAIVILVLELFLAYAYREHYRTLVAVK